MPLPQRNAHGPLRFPVQLVLRPHLNYRGFAGSLAAGTVRPGDRVRVLPSGREARVASVDFNGASLPSASAPLSVTVRLDDHVDVARGDMLVDPAHPPRVTDRFVATLVWMHERPLDPARRYLLKHTTRTVPARVETLLGRRDLDTLALVPAEGLGLNDIGPAVLRCERPLFVDPYATHRESGAFILIDALTHDTVAAGMIADEAPPPVTADASGYRSTLTPEAEAVRPVGALVWIDLPPPRSPPTPSPRRSSGPSSPPDARAPWSHAPDRRWPPAWPWPSRPAPWWWPSCKAPRSITGCRRAGPWAARGCTPWSPSPWTTLRRRPRPRRPGGLGDDAHRGAHAAGLTQPRGDGRRAVDGGARA